METENRPQQFSERNKNQEIFDISENSNMRSTLDNDSVHSSSSTCSQKKNRNEFLLGLNSDSMDALCLTETEKGYLASGHDACSVFEQSSDYLISSADDEQTHRKERRKSSSKLARNRSNSNRTRSGDDAAASFITGGHDWTGMTKHSIPMPNSNDDDDSDFANDSQHNVGRRRRFNSYSCTSPIKFPTSIDRRTSFPPENPDQMHHRHQLGVFQNESTDKLTLDTPQSTEIMQDSLFYSADDQSSVDMFKLNMQNMFQNDFNNQAELNPGSYSSAFSWLSKPDTSSPTLNSDNEQQNNVHLNSPPLHSPTFQPQPINVNFELQPINAPTQTDDCSLLTQASPTSQATIKDELIKSASATATFDFSSFNPFKNNVSDDEAQKYPTFICPKCGTRQRNFFTIKTVRGQFESPTGYFAFYLAIYLLASLFLFGMQEGWSLVDCIYFSVITLTTAGLGDLAPTTDSAKLICSVFIYFGVACIGLLLGSLLASAMDDVRRQEEKDALIENCFNCNRNQIIHRTTLSGAKQFAMSERNIRDTTKSKKWKPSLSRISSSSHLHVDDESTAGNKADSIHDEDVVFAEYNNFYTSDHSYSSQDELVKVNDSQGYGSIGSAMHRKVPLNNAIAHEKIKKAFRRSRALSDADIFGVNKRYHKYTADLHADASMGRSAFEKEKFSHLFSDEASNGSLQSEAYGQSNISMDFKYVLLTVKQAVFNSIFIILIGSFGFYYIENWTPVNSFYFTTVLLTTVGYGDIVPLTYEGKIFATAYVLIAGTVLLNNMSTISMIPLELRRRRQERVILTQFGDELDDAALRELATGALVRRLSLVPLEEGDEPHLAECTREMFSLAMLVRLGRITEQDVVATFDAFNRLDADRDGKLSSKDIICGKVLAKKKEKRKSMKKIEKKNKIENDPHEKNSRKYFTSPVNKNKESQNGSHHKRGKSKDLSSNSRKFRRGNTDELEYLIGLSDNGKANQNEVSNTENDYLRGTEHKNIEISISDERRHYSSLVLEIGSNDYYSDTEDNFFANEDSYRDSN